MNTFLTILFVLLVIVIILGVLYMYFYNKINETIIRVNEAENRIDNNLRDKYDTLNKCVTLIKGNIELDDKAFNELAKLKAKKISNFDLDRVLVTSHNELLKVMEDNKELRDSDELYKSIREIDEINEELDTLRKYYNENISYYNKLIKRLPTLFIAKIKHYKEKLFYDMKDMSDEDYEDFKL